MTGNYARFIAVSTCCPNIFSLSIVRDERKLLVLLNY